MYNSPTTEYEAYMLKKEQEWEALCKHCGACCGAFEDPCEHLIKTPSGDYICDIYDKRYGLHSSRGGIKFRCVPVRTILNRHWKNDHLCVYKARLKPVWQT